MISNILKRFICLALSVSLCSGAQQTINLGTAPTGVGGDNTRQGFTKANANFVELYARTVPAHINVLSYPDVQSAVDAGADAFSAVQAKITANPGRAIYMPAATYLLSQRLTLYGEGTVLVGEAMPYTTAGYGTVLKLTTPGEPGVIIPQGNYTGGVCNLAIRGCEGWTSYSRHQAVLCTGLISGVTGYADVNGSAQDGIRVEGPYARIQNVMIDSCGRDGVRLRTVTDGGGVRNSDTFSALNVKVQSCRGNGFRVEQGDDSSAGSFMQCGAALCLLWGFDERGFLGNSYYSPFSAYNHALSTAAETDTTHPANELTVGGVKIPAGNISWTRTSNLVTLTITDWAYVMQGSFPLKTGHGVVVSGTSQIDGTHLLVSTTQGASTTTLTFTVPGAEVTSAQTTGKIRAANPAETFAKAKALLVADSKLYSIEYMGGDLHRTVGVGLTAYYSPYCESSIPCQLNDNCIVYGFQGGVNIDFAFGNPQTVFGKRSGGGALSGPATNVWSQVHDADSPIQSFGQFGLTADQIHYHYRMAVAGGYISREDDAPTYRQLYKGNPATDATARLMSYTSFASGRNGLNSMGTAAVEVNMAYHAAGYEGGTGGFLIGDGQDHKRFSFRPLNVAPSDGSIEANECSLWFDSTNGASALMIKGKSANGTVVTYSVSADPIFTTMGTTGNAQVGGDFRAVGNSLIEGRARIGINAFTFEDGDIGVSRDIAPTTGIIYFGNDATRYLYHNGSKMLSSHTIVEPLYPVYANNAAAIAGGLSAGMKYRTGADPDPVCVVH